MARTLTSRRTLDKLGHQHSLWNIETMSVPANASHSCIVSVYLLHFIKASGACQSFVRNVAILEQKMIQQRSLPDSSDSHNQLTMLSLQAKTLDSWDR